MALAVGKVGNNSKRNLIERCDALYAWHKDAIYRLAVKALNGDEAWALEVLEACMMTAYRHIDKLEAENSAKTKAFMVAALQRILNEIYKEAWEKMGIPDPDKIENAAVTKKEKRFVDQILIRNKMAADLAKYVEKLTQRERELVFFKFFAGFSDEEIQEHFKITPNEVNDRIFSVKQKIAKLMTEESEMIKGR